MNFTLVFNSHKSLNVAIEVLVLNKKLSIMITYYPFEDIPTLVVELFSALVRVSSLLPAFDYFTTKRTNKSNARYSIFRHSSFNYEIIFVLYSMLLVLFSLDFGSAKVISWHPRDQLEDEPRESNISDHHFRLPRYPEDRFLKAK